MCRIRWFLVFMLLAIPKISSALQLHWIAGSTNLNFAVATRCTLVVQADSAGARLPSEWRLMWVADSAGAQFVARDSVEACLLDEAQVSRIDGPANPADTAANLITEHFCSAGSTATTTAQQMLDLPSGGHGKFKVIALDPGDPDRVIESNEVTYNGGVEDAYTPVVLHASSIHQSLQLRVTAVGSGLNAAGSMSIMATDSSWMLPLTITARSDGSMTGVAAVAAVLPACQASVGSESGTVSAATLPADQQPAPLDPQGCQAQYFENLLQPPPGAHGYTVQPKDFAFARGYVDASSNRYALHLFYIRHNYWYDEPPRQDDLNEKNIGHIWTTDFNSWYGSGGLNKPDTLALTARPNKFDNLHVWAPTIVQRGPTFWMFYTGVGSDVPGGPQHQRIGVATSTDLNSWTQSNSVVLTAPDVPWVSKDPVFYGHAQQLRDPFVMEDPIHPGQWLMYFVAVDSLRAPKMAVGAATSSDLVTWMALQNPFSSTERPTSQGATNVVESPHVFSRHGQWWMPYTVNLNQIFFETTTSADPADTVAADWINPVGLRSVTEGQPPELQYWHASEHLLLGSAEYLAAYDDNATSIDIKGIFPPANATVDSFLLSCPAIAGVGDRSASDGEVRMAVTRLRWGSPEVGLRLEMPSPMPVRLAVYDIAGRRRSTLLDRELPGGVTEVAWDGRDQGGTRIPSGVYFMRLTCARGARVSKLVIVR